MPDLPAVDWATTARFGRALVPPGPELTPSEIAAVVTDLRAAADRATDEVAKVTGLNRPAAAQVLVVDRASWLAAMAESAAVLLAEAGTPSARQPARLGGKVLGGQLAAVFSVLATRILGQFDPFVVPARLLLVAPNVVAAERHLGVLPSDFRLWVCLHEQTHRFQFGEAPWLRTHLLGLIGELLAADGPALTRPADLPRGTVLGGLLNADQRLAFDQLSAVMSLMEGHADVMMDRVGTAVVPTYPAIRDRFEARRDQGGLAAVVRRLLGFDVKLAQYRDGAAFCRHVLTSADLATLNRAFAAPELLPSLAEIRDPQRWLQRL